MQPHEMNQDYKCPVCESKTPQLVVANGKDLLLGFAGDFSVRRCLQCGFQFTFPYLAPAEMEHFYPDNYHVYQLSDSSLDEIRNGFKSIRSRARQWLFHNFCWYVPSMSEHASILEIGCSNGAFLRQLDNGERKLTGVELNTAASEFARQHGIRVFNSPFEEINFDEQFDDVFLWMVLEHLYKPHLALGKIGEILKPGGYLIFSIPNPESFDAKLFGKYWYNLDLPRHLNHFSKQWLEHQLALHGLKIEQVIHIGDITSFMVSLSFMLRGRRWVPNKLVSWLGEFENGAKQFSQRIVLWTFGVIYMNLTRLFKTSGRVIYVARKA